MSLGHSLTTVYSKHLHKGLLLAGTFVVLVNGALIPGMSLLVGFYIDSLNKAPDDVITIYIPAFAGYAALSILAASLLNFIFGRLACSLNYRMRYKILLILLGLQLEDIEAKPVGQVITSISGEVEQISQVTRDTLPQISISILTILYYIVLLFYYSWKYGLVITGIAIGVFFATFFPLKKIGLLQVQRFQTTSSCISILPEALSGIKTIKAFSAEKDVHTRFSSRLLSLKGLEQKIVSFQSLSTAVVCLVSYGIAVLVAWLGYYSVIQGENTIGQVTVLFMGVLNSNLIIRVISSRIVDFTKASKAAANITQSINGKVETTATATAPELVTGFSVEMKAVSFAYPKSKNLSLTNVSLSIPEGHVIAVVGPSGAGKSTLISLLLGFYNDYEGKITFGNVNISEYGKEFLRAHIGYVPQEPLTFHGTVEDNIRMGATEFSFHDVETSARFAGVHQTITELPEGYKTLVGPTSLSGGQKQRIGLARALLRKPKILLLDEPTSALDAIAEQHVQETISSLKRLGVSVLILAHRLNTIVNCDNIYVLQYGAVVEEGKYYDLLQRGGLFSNLFNLQQPVNQISRNRSNTR